MMKTKLKKGQNVKLLTGVDKGKSGEIIKLFPRQYRALVKGINIKKKHQKPTKEKKGGIVNIEKSVHLSNLILIDDKKKPEKINKEEEKKIETKKEVTVKKLVSKEKAKQKEITEKKTKTKKRINKNKKTKKMKTKKTKKGK